MATCEIHKIDSNIVGLRIAEEECLKLLPTIPAPVWNIYEPNSYSDFGPENTLTSRNPINDSRQRKKGVIVDLEASAGFNTDLTYNNLQDILQGFMYADTRVKTDYLITGAAEITVVPGELPELTVTGAGFVAAGVIPGEYVFLGGDAAGSAFTNPENNGFKRVRSVTADTLTFDKSYEPMVSETAAGPISVYLGRVLKNERGAMIKRRSYQLERTLGSLDGLDPPQSEYVIGAVPNELTINFPSAEKITADLTFMACKGETRTQAEGLKAGTRPALVEADAYNTTSHLQRVRMSQVVPGNASPVPLFGFVLESTLTLNNTASGNKALGVMGNFEITAGLFDIGGSITAYFSDVLAVRAVQNNEDITMDYTLVKDNQGMVIDMPLIALGDGRLTVELDQPIMLPLTPMAATGSKIDPNLDHTLLWTFFDTLPDLAEELVE